MGFIFICAPFVVVVVVVVLKWSPEFAAKVTRKVKMPCDVSPHVAGCLRLENAVEFGDTPQVRPFIGRNWLHR